ncbi:MAG: hypothetical protein M1822_004886 [Bathelium mastoideum]|nr:MAG: hypothetical protein M1822_004886 [Bathelium mastoideum]
MDANKSVFDQARYLVIDSLPFPPEINPSSPIPFFHILERLKTNKREGWRRFGLFDGESIGDHMYRMSIMTMLAPASLSSRLDLHRCTSMALVHDMAESLVGDITPVDGVDKTEKNRRESTTMDFLCQHLLGNVGNGNAGEKIRELWQEYEDSHTLEAKFVHDVDKLELLLQMVEYERTGEGRTNLSEFSHVAKKIELEEMHAWAEEILKERVEFWKGFGGIPHAQVSEELESQLQEYYGKGTANVS